MKLVYLQVVTTHLYNMRQGEHQSEDEKVKQMGKSNLDKWLQALLFKDAASPELSQISESLRHQVLTSTH